MPELTVNGTRVRVPEGATLLDAARAAGAAVPTLCYRGEAEHEPSCFVCVVALAGREEFVPACAFLASEGAEVTTDSEPVLRARRRALELLLSDHLGECLAPCQLACPARWAIPEFAEALAHDDPRTAAAIAAKGLILPATLGYVCTAGCEKACRRRQRDQTVSIRALHRFTGENLPAELPVAPGDSGKRVAVVGAGPAGLAAGARLRALGHAAVLFERQGQPGGSLRDVDGETLPPAVLDEEIRRVLATGVELRAGAPADPAELAGRFDAVILAAGEPVAHDHATRQCADLPSVLVAGAAAGKGRLAIVAVADGMQVAEAVSRILAGAEPQRRREAVVRYGALTEHEQEALLARGADRRRIERPADAAEAGAEASRCLMCGCRDNRRCRLRRLATELGARVTGYTGQRRPLRRDESHPLIEFEPHKCILCGACVRAAAAESDQPGLTFLSRGFAATVGGPYDSPLGESLGAEALQCARVCPTSAIVIRRYPTDEPETPA